MLSCSVHSCKYIEWAAAPQVVTTDGDARLGGDDIDRAIVQWIQRQHEQRGEDWCGTTHVLITVP